MVKKIICEFEDVKNFERFQMYDYDGNKREYIKVPLLEHTIEVEPVPWDLTTVRKWKANAIHTAGWNRYVFIEPNKEVYIYS